jgi:hypothetical protein
MNQIEEDDSTNLKFASLFDLIADKSTQTVRVDQIRDLLLANTGSGNPDEPSPIAIYFDPLRTSVANSHFFQTSCAFFFLTNLFFFFFFFFSK